MRKKIKFLSSFVVIVLIALVVLFFVHKNRYKSEARGIIKDSNITGGLVIHLGCGSGELTGALHLNDSYLVQGLETDTSAVSKARGYIQSKKLYGKVSIRQFNGKDLPYIDNLVNLIIVEPKVDVNIEECMRALCPKGVVLFRENGEWEKLVKPLPEDIDEWTHSGYDASGNPVSKDRQVGPPKHLQWTAGPKWTRHHEAMSSFPAMVSAQGRIFYILDEGPRVSLFLPSDWKLVARDAFNGKILWKKKFYSWVSRLYPYKSGPTQMKRKLVTANNRVFVSPGLKENVHILEASTGKTLRVLQDSSACEEILFHDGILYLMTNDKPTLYEGEHRFSLENAWSGQKKWIKAVDPETGEELWKKETPIAPMSFVVNERGVYFHDGQYIFCLDLKSGREIWKSEHILLDNVISTGVTPTMVVYKDVIMFFGGDDQSGYRGGSGHYVSKNLRTFYALSSKTGELLWWYRVKPNTNGFEAPKDILVLDDLVWLGEIFGGRASGKWIGRDLKTGEIKREFALPWDIYWFHQRCYSSRATERYILPSRTGIEFVNPIDGYISYNHWIRGVCLYGIMPANGLVYAPCHPCACYMESLLHGFNAMAPASKHTIIPEVIAEEGRIQEGPGFGNPVTKKGTSSEEWPTFRADRDRSGYTKMLVSKDLKPVWKTKIGEDLTALTIACNRVFVAEKEKHLLHAINAETGLEAWQFMAGGRIDSPPTIADGKVVFGSLDGYVYCIDADSGELVWKYRAAPIDRNLVAYEQVESVWPVHGSTLIINGVVYCIAGRSMFIDDGMRFLALDLHIGRKITEQVLNDTDPTTKGMLQDKIDNLSMPVANSDILTYNNKYIYLKSQKFNLDGTRPVIEVSRDNTDQLGDDAHLLAPAGFLDNTGFHRVSMLYGKVFASGIAGHHTALRYAPGGKMIVFDNDKVYGYSRLPHLHRWTRELEFHIFEASKEERIKERIMGKGQKKVDIPLSKEYADDIILHASNEDEKGKKRLLKSLTETVIKYNWSNYDPSMYVNSMVLTGKTLFVAGPPAIRNENTPDAVARWQGKKGGVLWSMSAETGEKLTEYVLEAPTVYEGMAAAYGKLYLSLMDGSVVCMDKTKD